MPVKCSNMSASTKPTHIFAANPLDRADALRRDEAAVVRAAADSKSRYLPLWNLNVLVQAASASQTTTLGWLDQAEIARLGIDGPPVLLGLEEDIAHFAIDLSSLHDPTHELSLGSDWQFEDARRAAMTLPAFESGILAQARSQLDWHRRHQFCSVCGERTEQHKGGHVRRCGRQL